jgi:hypothetical protein
VPDDRSGPVTRAELLALKELITLRFDALDREERLRNDSLELARSEMNRRLEGMNEFRAQMNRAEQTYLTRGEWTLANQAVEVKLTAATNSAEGRFRSLEKLVYIGVGLAIAISTIASFLLRK